MRGQEEPIQPQREPQAKPWSEEELRRVTRVFELLIQIDRRLKGKKRNEQPHG